MKKIRMISLALFASAMLGFSTPINAQNDRAASTQTTADNDNTTNYSWIGLLGLIGLAGLMKKNKEVSTDRSARPVTGSAFPQ